MSPRMPIFNMLGPSPLCSIESHMDKVLACAEKLLPFLEAALNDNWSQAEMEFQGITKLEAEADDLKRDLRLHLHKDLFLPVPRSDLLTMLMLQDRIANKAKDIAGLILNRHMHLPDVFKQDYIELLKRCVDAVMQARKAINELDDLLEAGFKGSEVKLVQNMLLDLDKIEQETDNLQQTIRMKLFRIEKELHPMDCVALYKLIEWTGALADRAETVGGQLQILLAS